MCYKAHIKNTVRPSQLVLYSMVGVPLTLLIAWVASIIIEFVI